MFTQLVALELVGHLREQVESGVRAWVAKTLLGRLVVELAKLLVPASAIISAIEKVYTTVLFFVEKAGKFQALVSTIVGALPAIAAGQVGAAAGEVEKTLGRLVPLALGFVADFFGLGGLTDAVRAQLQKARDWVQKIIQRLIEKVGKLVDKGLTKGQQLAGQAVSAGVPQDPHLRLQAGLQTAAAAVDRLPGTKLSALALRPVLAAVRLRYQFQSLEAQIEQGRWVLYGQVNPRGSVPTSRLAAPAAAPRPPVQVDQPIRARYQSGEMQPALITEVDETAEQVEHRFTNTRLIIRRQQNSFIEFNAKLSRGEITLVNLDREYLMNNRPKYRSGLVQEVWDQAKDTNGRVFDPNVPTIELFWDPSKPRTDQWHMGHKANFEYRRMVDRYISGRITYPEFLKEYQNAANYQPEDPIENVGHQHEAP